jgi:RNA polymerase-binding transcription factor DksA
MITTTTHQRESLTQSQLREIRAELTRESRRLGSGDPRAHAFAAALDRIENGTYGHCATCGDGIPYERLSVVPETVYCVNCRRDREAS